MRIVSRTGIGKNPGTVYHLDVSGSSNFDGQVFFQNTAFFNAGVELGDTSADLISVNGRVDTNIEPSATLTRDFGSSSLFWNNTYSKNLIIKNAGSIESDENTLNVGANSATTINIGTTAATAINIGFGTGTTTINSPSVVAIGNLQVRGGSLTTNQTTFNLINTTATTLNIGGSATTITIGTSTGTTSINGALSLNPIGTATGQGGVIRFKELAANGSNYIALRAPDVLGSDITLTLPSTVGAYNQVLTADGLGGTSWNDIYTSTTTTVSGVANAALGSSFRDIRSGNRTIAIHNLKDGQSLSVLVQGAANNVITITAFSDAGTTSVPVKYGAGQNGIMASAYSLFTIYRIGGDINICVIGPIHGIV